MSAPDPEPRKGMEAVALRLYRTLPPREQRAYLDALRRVIDGQPLEDALVEALVEVGEPPEDARQQVRAAILDRRDWRVGLH